MFIHSKYHIELYHLIDIWSVNFYMTKSYNIWPNKIDVKLSVKSYTWLVKHIIYSPQLRFYFNLESSTRHLKIIEYVQILFLGAIYRNDVAGKFSCVRWSRNSHATWDCARKYNSRYNGRFIAQSQVKNTEKSYLYIFADRASYF